MDTDDYTVVDPNTQPPLGVNTQRPENGTLNVQAKRRRRSGRTVYRLIPRYMEIWDLMRTSWPGVKLFMHESSE